MEQYNPLYAPGPAAWLALSESECIDLSLEHHQKLEVELPNEKLHSTIHVVVENQLALGEEIVQGTLNRLIQQGVDRHEAVHAIGAVLSEYIYDLLSSRAGGQDNRRYYGRLNKLTVKRWRKGKW